MPDRAQAATAILRVFIDRVRVTAVASQEGMALKRAHALCREADNALDLLTERLREVPQ